MPDEIVHAEPFYRSIAAAMIENPQLSDAARAELVEILDPEKVPTALLASRIFAPGRPGPTGKARNPKVEVYVDEGRWVARCPFCPSAQMATRDADATFYCSDCLNRDVGGKTVPLVWPDDRDAIEEELLCRPSPLIRHWAAGESTDQLHLENVALGVSAPRTR